MVALLHHHGKSATNKALALFALLILSQLSQLTAQQLTPVLQISDARCFGLRGKMTVQDVIGGQAPYFYSLDSITYSTNPNLVALVPGQHILYVRDNDGRTGTLPFQIGQPKQLEVVLNANKTLVKPNESLELTVEVIPADARLMYIRWRPQNKFPETLDRTNEVSILQNTTFSVEVADSAHCVAYDHVDVKVHESDVYIPNVIKQRPTDGMPMQVYGGSRIQLVKSMVIADRYGHIVYSQKNLIPNDTSNGWNGSQDGKPAVPGVYLYQVELLFDDGTTEFRTGDVTVVP